MVQETCLEYQETSSHPDAFQGRTQKIPSPAAALDRKIQSNHRWLLENRVNEPHNLIIFCSLK